MFLIFIPGVFYKLHLPEKKGKKNQILLYYHIFIKLNHFSYMMLSICLCVISTQRVKGYILWLVLSGQLVEAD